MGTGARVGRWSGRLAPGLLVYFLFGRCDEEAGRFDPPGAPCLWLADRDAGAIVVLDAGLAEVERVPCKAPFALASRSAETCIVAAALDARATGRQALVWIEGGVEIGTAPLGGDLRALVAIGERGGEVLALVRFADESVLIQCHWRSGDLRWEFEAPLGVALDSRGEHAVVGGDDGRVELVRLADPPVLVAARVLASPVVDVAFHEDGAGVWVSLADGTLARLGSELEVLLLCGPFGTDSLVECGAGGAWILDRASAVLIRVDEEGAIRARTELAPEQPTSLCVLEDGRAVIALCGAVIAVERDGRTLASAGGFEGLTALEAQRISGDP